MLKFGFQNFFLFFIFLRGCSHNLNVTIFGLKQSNAMKHDVTHGTLYLNMDATR